MAKILKLLILVMVVLLLVNCKVKQPVVKTITNYDTIVLTKTERITVPVINTVTIEEPCDSLGILNNFKQTIHTDKADVIISNQGGNIVVELNLDSIKQVWTKELNKSEHTIIEEVVREVYKPFIPKWVYFVILYSVLATVYIFRRFIPFLRFIP